MVQHISNIITTIRLILAIIIIYLFTQTDCIVGVTIMFIIAAVSDAFDGWIARKLNTVTKFGEQFDPIADKVLTLSLLFAFAIEGIIPMWCVIIIAIRDVANTIFRFLFLTKKNIPTSFTAKLKTVIQLVFISAILLIKLAVEVGIAPQNYADIIYSPIIDYCIIFIAAISIWTLIEYIISFRKFQYK